MTAPTTDRSRRSYAVALVALAAGAVAVILSFGLTWQSVETELLPGSSDAVGVVSSTGRDLYPGAAVAGWLALASVAGIIATRSWGRVAIAVVAGLAGAAAVAAAADFGFVTRPGSTLAWVPALAAGLGVTAVAIWTAARGRRWPALGSRYERHRSAASSVSPWQAQDLGQDPTDDLVE